MSTAEQLQSIRTSEDVRAACVQFRGVAQRLREEIGRVLVGQEQTVTLVLVALFANGHVLLEGVPGLGKTLLVRTLGQALGLRFSRVQFTPDLMPADIIGTQIVMEDPRTGKRDFAFRPGPLFTQILLADEINRASPKSQSALLEAMQERSITVGGTTHSLEQPFLVLATQNPIEQEGTYPLPEAQVDRFMLKLHLTYPSKDEELAILDRMALIEPDVTIEPVLSKNDIFELRKTIDGIYLDDKVKKYIVEIVHATRRPKDFGLNLETYIQYGASPRATIFLTRGAKGQAFLEGRSYVTPQDIKTIGYDILRHRVTVTYEAEAEEITSEQLLKRIFDQVKVP